MKIYLVRHGIAVEGLIPGITRDSERPLTDEGITEMKMVARGLKHIGVAPDLIVASPLVRTKQTADILQTELGGELTTCDALAPGVTPASVYKFLKKYPNSHEMFLVGHEPDMGDLVREMIGAGYEFSLPFTKAGVCCVEVADLPPTLPGMLKWLITPKIFVSLLSSAVSRGDQAIETDYKKE